MPTLSEIDSKEKRATARMKRADDRIKPLNDQIGRLTEELSRLTGERELALKELADVQGEKSRLLKTMSEQALAA